MSKLLNIKLLFPNNVLIFIHYKYLLIKGPCNIVKKDIYNYKKNLDFFYNIKSIRVIYSTKKFNTLIITINNKDYCKFKNEFHIFLYDLNKIIDYVYKGFYSLLQTWGIGFKILKSNNNTYFFLGYNHAIEFNKNYIYNKPIKGNYLFLTSENKEKLNKYCKEIKKLRTLDIYKGKGVRYINETVRLKQGKKE